MFNPLLSVMFGPQAGADDERYAGKTLKSHGFSSSPSSTGQLAFDLKGNRMNDRVGAMQAGGQGLGQIIKLLTYLKGIGAFKGSAFDSAMKPQMSANQPMPMSDVQSGFFDDPATMNTLWMNRNEGQARQAAYNKSNADTAGFLEALMMLNQRGA